MSKKLKLHIPAKNYRNYDVSAIQNHFSDISNERYGEMIPSAFAWQLPDEVNKKAEELAKPIY